LKNQLWAVSEEACCPFKHHSRASLRQLLQPCSGIVLHKICRSVDTGDYCGACRLYLDSLTPGRSVAYDGDCVQTCSSNTVVKFSVNETVGPQHTPDQQNDMEVEQTADSGYDSAQSHQPEQNSYISALSSQSSGSFEALNIAKSNAHQQSKSTKMAECGTYNVRQDDTGSEYDIVIRKLHSPVDFYTSFSCLVTGLYLHAVP